MVYEADTLRDIIVSNWSLSGNLSLTFNSVTNPYPVTIDTFHMPVSLDNKKSVTVRKPNSQVNEVTHELFKELRDTYEITVKYNVEGIDDATWDEAESNTEDMEEEVIRILKTVYDPNAQTGVWFQTDFEWRNQDNYEAQPPWFIRTLILTLTRITSFKTTIFHGFGGVLVFKISGSEGTGLPGGDYTYTEAYDVMPSEGYDDVEELISGHPTGPGIAIHFTADFHGAIQFKTYIKKADIGAGSHQLNSIGKPLANGEVPEVYIMHDAKDLEGPVITLRETYRLRVTNVQRIHVKNQLAGMVVTGKLIEPTVYALV